MKDPLPGDLGLVLKTKDKLAALSSRLKRPFVFYENPFVLQYEVLFQEGQGCGGAYLKLLSEGIESNLSKFHEKTPYTIMFGPDKCGSDHNHFIFRHKNPLNGNFEEKHCKKPKDRIDDNFSDRKPHLYTLVVNPDNTFQIFVDHKLVNNGSLLEDFTPAVNPPEEIDDPNDFQPSDWDDREKIMSTTAVKPDDWDESAPEKIPDLSVKMPDGWLENEPTHVPDPLAEKPSDWDNSMDGEWEAPLVANPACDDAPGCGKWEPPMIRNPQYKGKWTPPLIDNPNYQGKWKPRRIPNPYYFEDKQPFRMTSIVALGFELWTTSRGILFDNIIITDRFDLAEELAHKTYDLKKKLMEIDADTFVNRFITFTNAYPWLWAVYVVVLLLPITLIFVFCFGSSSKVIILELFMKLHSSFQLICIL
ncbi:hypothetical protein AAG570_012964 [Ranatra chinensis]|uniref:Calnexin n=1 Tax=Ranatra chinensis TaxID=642074 RepID=A0ABD0YFD3_9HEMI